MDFSLTLINGELRSLLRNMFERLIGSQVKKKENKYLDIVNKLTIRVIGSLLAIYLFRKLGEARRIDDLKKYVPIVAIVLFFILNYKR